jgi:lipopolysaccharide export system protein LptA
MYKFLLLFLLWWYITPSRLYAQAVQFSADNIEGLIDSKGNRIRRLTGNVVFKQPGRTLYSQQADQFQDEDKMVFKGGVRIEQDNGATITGDTLQYFTNTKKARIIGNVVLIDKTMMLTTDVLDYDMESGMAIYRTGGVIIDGPNRLTSQYGRFDRANDKMFFQGNVFLADGESQLNTDSLEYFSKSGNALFFGKTKIVNKEGTIYSSRGNYNTQTKKGNFKGRSRIEAEEYTIEGDSIQFDRTKQTGRAKGRVVLFDKKDSLTVTGNEAQFSDQKGYSKIFGEPLVKYPMEQKDTLFLTGDTLYTENQNIPNKRRLRVYYKAKFMMKDIQGICDSLSYSFEDSMIRFYRNPVIWSGDNQITADTIFAQMANKQIESLTLRLNSFIVSKDTLGNFNQLKGKNMVAHFANNNIQKLFVYGNGQSIYFALENDTALIGMNKMNCTDIIVSFKEKNQLASIKALTQPDGIFYPPHEIEEPEKKLKGFSWRIKQRPDRQTFVEKEVANTPISAPVKPTSTPKTVKKPVKPAKPKATKKQ